ncbi:MAG: hypothetical protein ACLQIB_12455 [Isosphaeraceae bacterium]
MRQEDAFGISVGGPSGGESRKTELVRLTKALTERPRAGMSQPAGLCACDRRIESFLDEYFAELKLDAPLRLPAPTLVLTKHGVAREMSLPEDADSYDNAYVRSYRVRNGVLHNPRSDRRTTAGTFHIAEGGLPIPGDKKAVSRRVAAVLLRHALSPPADLLVVPFTSGRRQPTRSFVSLLLRPIVSPGVPGVFPGRTMEIRFFAPGSLVSNLDFVESIFGNAGDPSLPVNDSALDVEHWTGHTGCVLLAPHLTQLTKKDLGLPPWESATERERRDGMAWREPHELYNDGGAFKITCRSKAGVIVTVIADNYFGYCKKEVKTQISFAANLAGGLEEEHSGGALAFASYNLGYEFDARDYSRDERSVDDVALKDHELLDLRPDGYAVDRQVPELLYIPADAKASIQRLQIWWFHAGREFAIPLEVGKTYMTPAGYKVRLEKHPGAASWRLIGTVAEGVFCHKPCTVSGGGKSEISKSLRDYMLYGPIFVADRDRDFDLVQQIFDRDYSTRWKPGCGPDYAARASRPVLSPDRSLGSVIKLLTPSDDYSDDYNRWLASFPNYIYPIVFIIKRFAPREMLGRWRDLFGVDSINGFPGHELKAFGRKLVGTYLRVGLLDSLGWRTFKVRQDFAAAAKVPTEDDITASVVVPGNRLKALPPGPVAASYKFAVNCEWRLFQRPDDAIHRGLDRQTEADLARPDNFLSNFEPLSSEQARAQVDRITEFDEFTSPMQRLLHEAAEAGTGYAVCSAYPRIVNGKPSKNPRYLQTRPDLIDPRPAYIAERGIRLSRRLGAREPLVLPVGAVLVGRRNNPPEPELGIRPLAVYGPIHYQELPELFMDFICSLTGKSPSTTGAGSEGAMTKGPFNALRTVHDLNAALVSYILTGLGGFSTAAGYVGPKLRVDHDISLLVPEIWCRLTAQERDPSFLISEGHLEAVRDFEHAGRPVLASRLGYRITAKFVRTFLGRVFDNPHRVFEDDFLRPETQDLGAFADGVHNITEAQARVASQYLEDGQIEDACPPLRALLLIMAQGAYDGRNVHHADVRRLFTREAMLSSDWYRDRLRAQQRGDERLWRRHLASLDAALGGGASGLGSFADELLRRRDLAVAALEQVTALPYLDALNGTIGLDPRLAPD